jgi:hypothetical protein
MKKKSIKIIKAIFFLSSCDENGDEIKIDMKPCTVELSSKQVDHYKSCFKENFKKILDIEKKKKEWYEELESKYPKGNEKNEKIRNSLIVDFEEKQKKLLKDIDIYLNTFFDKKNIPGKISGDEKQTEQKLEDDFRKFFGYSESNYFPLIFPNLQIVKQED